MSSETKDIVRMKELIRILQEAANAYYTLDMEIMSNAEYDSLYEELTVLEKKTGIVLAGSLTNKVGYELLENLPKEKHSQPRLSLDKTKEVSALKSFLGSHDGILMWKLDGLTIVLTYENGELVKGLTRGNGEIGEVVTKNISVFSNVPLKIPYKKHLMLRGEAIIKYSDFEEMNLSLAEEEKYKNPRNLCSGSVRQLNTEITAKRRVHYLAYELLEGGEGYSTRVEEIKFLKLQGFETVSYLEVNSETMEQAIETYSKNVLTSDFPSDGLVLQFNDIVYGNSLGRTSKFPKHSIAFKWKDETAETVIRQIEWSASRTGLLNPIAVFDSVELEGTTVSRASLHNVSIMKHLKLGIGDRVRVYKANMIIPQVLENLTQSDSVRPIEACPVCMEKTELKEENGIQTLYCKNPDCMAKKIKLLTHFVSRDAMNIAGLSEMTLEKFVSEGMIHQLSDLFQLHRYKEKIVKMEGFGEKSFYNLMQAIEAAKQTTAVRLLFSLGIPNIGLRGAKLICKFFENDFERVMGATEEELLQIAGIGPVMAKLYVTFFQDVENRKLLDSLRKELCFLEEGNESNEKKSLDGLTFVVTGDVTKFKNRKELTAFIESKGAKVTGSVTGKTDYLINNDVHSGSGKNKKAKELGIKIINEDEFMALLGGNYAD